MGKIKKIKKKIKLFSKRVIVQCKKWYIILYGSFLYKRIKCFDVYIDIKHKAQMLYIYIQKFIYAFKYKFSLRGFIENIFYAAIVSLVSYFVFSKASSQNSAFWQTCLGFILGIYGTYVYENLKKLVQEIKYLNLTIPCINNIYGMANSVFHSFFNHPLDDAICKRGNKIIYVSPCKAGGGYDEQLMSEYTNMMENMDFDTFWSHFRKQKTRVLIQDLKKNFSYFNNTYSTILHRQDSLDENLFIVFSQFYQELNGFLYLDTFQWQDTQVQYLLFRQIKVLIYKNNMTLLLAQKELSKVKMYLKYASNTTLKMKQERIRTVQKITELGNETFNFLTKATAKFSSKEQKYILNKIFKNSSLKNIGQPMDNKNE